MSSVENRIVSIKFDNQQFEANVAQTLASLDKLSEKLTTVGAGAGQGFGDINKAAQNVNLDGMASGIDKIASKFDALGAIGFTAIQTITTGVLGFTKQFAATDILQPILGGGKQRAEDLQQAEFSFNAFGINVAEVMKNANDAVLGTAFSLSDAAKAAGQLAAAGVQAGAQMTSTLRAIAGVSAVTGDTFTDMSTIFTQAAASGKVTNQDLLQLSTRGLNAAAFIATQLGTTQQAVHAMATNGTLDFNTFATALDKAFGAHATEANQTYTGALDNLHAALARLGAAFISPELNQKRDLFNALSPALAQVQKALAPIEFTILAIRGTLTNDLIGKINGIALFKLPEITSFVSPNIATGLQNIINLIGQFSSLVKDAFKDIFPADFVTNLVLFSDDFADLTAKFKIGADSFDKIRSILDGVFSVIDIGIAIVKGLLSVIGDIVKALFPAGSGLLNAGAGLGNFLQKADELLVKGGKIQDFFDELGRVIAKPVAFIGELVAKITDFFTKGFGSDAITGLFDKVGDRVQATEQDVQGVQGVWDRLMQALSGVFKVLDTIWDGIKTFFDELKDKIKNALKPADFNSSLDAINVGLLGAITLMLKKFFAGGVKFGLGGGVFGQVKNSLRQVTVQLQLMQTNLKAEALLRIAAAMALLTASIVALSLINSANLTKALSAIAVGFGELAATFLILDKSVLNPASAAKIAILSFSMIGLAAALVILSAAVAIMGKLSLSEIAKGLAGVGASMVILVSGVNAIDADTAGMVSAGIAMGIIAVALRIIADVVKVFAGLSLEQLGKGLGGVTAGIVILVTGVNSVSADTAGLVSAGISIGIISVALRILADAVKAFAGLSLKELGKGLGSVAVGLTIFVTALNLLDAEDAELITAGIAIGIISLALRQLANDVKAFGNIPFDKMIHGIEGIAAIMAVLVIAMLAMDEALPGAAATLVISVALEVLASALTKIGALSIAQLGTALGAVVAFLVVLGALADLGSETIPFIAALGLALVLVGTGFALLGAGAFLAATALGVLAEIGVPALEKIVNALPDLAAGLALFVVNLLRHFLEAIPTLLKVVGAVIDQLAETLIKSIPKVAKVIGVLIDNLAQLIEQKSPELISAGLFLVNALLDGFGNHAKDLVDSVDKLVTNLSSEIVKHAGDFSQAAVNLIQAFIQVIDNSQTAIIIAAASLIVSLISGISQGVGLILQAAADLITTFITELGAHVGDIITAGANMLINLLIGITNNLVNIVDTVGQIIITFITALENEELTVIAAGVNLIIAFMFGISQQALKLADAAGQCILNFINGLDDAVNKYEPAIIAATIRLGFDIIAGIFRGLTTSLDLLGISSFIHNLGSDVIGWAGDVKSFVSRIGSDIIHGIWQGIEASATWFKDQIKNFITSTIPGFFQKILGIGSPSKVMADLAVWVPAGIAQGIDSSSHLVENGMTNLSNKMIAAFNPDPKDLSTTFATVVAQLNGMDEFNPTITPVLDLSKVKAAAGGISDALGTTDIIPNVSTANATGISKDLLASAAAALEAAKAVPTEPGDVIFNQTNNSPKALSTDDVYRGTRSQLTLAKEELAIP